MSIFGSLFKSKSGDADYPAVTDYSSVVTDIHSHLIPGIDDGVKTIDESLAMLRNFYSLGFRKIVTTPHVMSDYFKNNPDTILGGLETVRNAIQTNGMDITIDAAAEYYLDEYFIRKLGKERMLTIGDNYLLFEISYINPPDNINSAIFEMNVNGYQPLLAHPERYDYWYQKIDSYRKIKDAGVLFQLNINSLTGYYGIAARRTAEKLIDENMIDFIGSDLHGERHLKGLRRAIDEKYMHKLLAQGIRNPSLFS